MSKSAYRVLESYQESNIPSSHLIDSNSDNKSYERIFHDRWSQEIDVDEIDVDKVVGACTAPELRFIFNKLGSLNGKKVLDIGCGFGEASIQFARLGAEVYSLDISSGMLDQALKLASKYHVSINTMQGDVENLPFTDNYFDIVYAGNVLHHAEVEKVIKSVTRVLKQDGCFAIWDPLAYNPLINIYRRLAAEVRTPGEHPIRRRDVRLITKSFRESEIKFTWLSTLLIFLHMFVMQLRSPRKERFWKKILDEADEWKPFYLPLEALDKLILKILPFTGWLCWNVVIVARRPK